MGTTKKLVVVFKSGKVSKVSFLSDEDYERISKFIREYSEKKHNNSLLEIENETDHVWINLDDISMIGFEMK